MGKDIEALALVGEGSKFFFLAKSFFISPEALSFFPHVLGWGEHWTQ